MPQAPPGGMGAPVAHAELGNQAAAAEPAWTAVAAQVALRAATQAAVHEGAAYALREGAAQVQATLAAPPLEVEPLAAAEAIPRTAEGSSDLRKTSHELEEESGSRGSPAPPRDGTEGVGHKGPAGPPPDVSTDASAGGIFVPLAVSTWWAMALAGLSWLPWIASVGHWPLTAWAVWSWVRPKRQGDLAHPVGHVPERGGPIACVILNEAPHTVGATRWAAPATGTSVAAHSTGLPGARQRVAKALRQTASGVAQARAGGGQSGEAVVVEDSDEAQSAGERQGCVQPLPDCEVEILVEPPAVAERAYYSFAGREVQAEEDAQTGEIRPRFVVLALGRSFTVPEEAIGPWASAEDLLALEQWGAPCLVSRLGPNGDLQPQGISREGMFLSGEGWSRLLLAGYESWERHHYGRLSGLTGRIPPGIPPELAASLIDTRALPETREQLDALVSGEQRRCGPPADQGIEGDGADQLGACSELASSSARAAPGIDAAPVDGFTVDPCPALACYLEELQRSGRADQAFASAGQATGFDDHSLINSLVTEAERILALGAGGDYADLLKAQLPGWREALGAWTGGTTEVALPAAKAPRLAPIARVVAPPSWTAQPGAATKGSPGGGSLGAPTFRSSKQQCVAARAGLVGWGPQRRQCISAPLALSWAAADPDGRGSWYGGVGAGEGACGGR